MAQSIIDTLSTQVNDLTTYLSQRPRQATGAALTTTSLALVAFVLYDYHAWRSFGTGGTPPTWAGYWSMTKTRFKLLLSGDNMADPSPLSTSAPRYLPKGFSAKKRSGNQPRIMARTMPQRQYPYPDSSVEPGVREKVASMMYDFSAKYPDLLVLAPSKTEGGSTDGIYVNKSLDTLNPIVGEPRNRLLDGEIAHAHPSEGSLHIWLSQADARTVVEGGWGLRFPLEFVDKGWTMVFAPRTMEEVAVVEEIVKAGIGWLAGVSV
jgi:Family of unknown function (DUF5519)